MRAIKKPSQEPLYVYQLCISRIVNGDIKERLNQVSKDIELAAVDYDLMASTQKLYAISPINCGEDDIALGRVTRKELNNTYKNQMRRRGKPARRIYDELLFAPNQICPFCGLSQVATLDHYLPKSKYPQFSVLPSNLVPACQDCNSGKGAKITATPEEQVLHPYFDHDHFIDEQWLYAEVKQTSPVVIRFFVQPPNKWDNTSQARVENHFKEFDLSRRYSIQAADETISICSLLTISYAGIDNSLAKQFIKEELKTHAKVHAEQHINSWKTAMFQALADSEWYCKAGFRLS